MLYSRHSLALLLGLAFSFCAGYTACMRRLQAYGSRSQVHRLRVRAATCVVSAQEYLVPLWVPQGVVVPQRRLQLAHLPTPIHTWSVPRVSAATQVMIKRDDCSGCELSGNKVRKLEFLLAEAVWNGCDTVITVGGIQSNHCRASAAAARCCGLEPHIILRTPDPDVDDPGLVGNLMVE